MSRVLVPADGAAVLGDTYMSIEPITGDRPRVEYFIAGVRVDAETFRDAISTLQLGEAIRRNDLYVENVPGEGKL